MPKSFTEPMSSRISSPGSVTSRGDAPEVTKSIERELAGGTYRFSVWADDGVRIWVDDTLIIDGWVEGGAAW